MQLPDCVLIELEKDKRLSTVERALYLLAWAHDPASISELARIARMDRGSAAHACQSLERLGWMKLVKQPRSVRPAAIIPDACQIIMAHDLEEEYALVPYKGEFLARKRMDWYLRRNEYVCNAHPAFLVNPETKKPLEYDTYDRKEALATEYNGSQHYRETADYKQEDVDKQKAHDLMKQSLSERNGVTLLTFTYRDLRPGILEARLDAAVPHLKRGYVDMTGPYAKILNRICDNYATRVERIEKAAAQKQSGQ
ncbi:MAG: hypothetical protein ACM3WU_05110 [Bacillota bacterium]